LAIEPAILVADEPVSALDVSVQAQVLRLLADIRGRLNLTMLFITHDLRVAAQVCDSIAMMRGGEIVECGATASVYANPQHAYTRELLEAVPRRIGMRRWPSPWHERSFFRKPLLPNNKRPRFDAFRRTVEVWSGRMA